MTTLCFSTTTLPDFKYYFMKIAKRKSKAKIFKAFKFQIFRQHQFSNSIITLPSWYSKTPNLLATHSAIQCIKRHFVHNTYKHSHSHTYLHKLFRSTHTFMCTQMSKKYLKLFREWVANTSSDRLPTRRICMYNPH